MPVEIVMPKLGLTMASGTIARWIKQPGEAVREGEPLLEVSTDKISYEVEAPASGTVARALGHDGEEFACGAVIGLIQLAGESDAPPSTAPDAVAPQRLVEAPRISAAGNGVAPTPASMLAPEELHAGRTVASPAARRLARERGVALRELRGTGPRGRITVVDVEAVAGASDAAPRASASLPPRLPAARREIFRKMTEVGMLPLPQVETLARVDTLRALLERRGDAGWTAFAVYAVARLLREHAELRTDAATGAPFERIDVGVAADTVHGLIVPVVRDAATRTLAETQREIVRLAGLARDGALSREDVGGASFSISNVGPQGIERVAPLPDPPQTAILGIGAATQRPAVVDGAIVPAWMLTCVLTFDHRFIDGAPAARFLAALRTALEDPGVLL
jgi:pyruvate dehydrogenase E2 component (dihydrolipoamide acetyltransferase)